MGLRDDIQADIAEAFDTDLADAVRPFTGLREVAGEYDPVTGATPNNNVNYQGRGVFGGYSLTEIDGQHILATDRRLTALQNEVVLTVSGEPTTAPEAPKIDDKINGLDVVQVGKDPASVSWIIQLRRA